MMTNVDMNTVEALIRAALDEGPTEGPWQVLMKRDELGSTCYSVTFHTHASIVIDPAGYYEEGYKLAVDEDGYFQPDESADCSPHRIATAKYIAASNPSAMRVLLGEIDRLRALHEA